jgi:hypothetical protein
MMRKFEVLSIVILYLLVSGFDTDPYYYQYKPVFMLRSELEKSVKLESPRNIQNPGKIYMKDNLIFINEKYRGIHVINNSNPQNPGMIAFIHIDGCIDMAMKDNILYADNATDLVSLSLKPDMLTIDVTSRIKNVFPELRSPEGRQLAPSEEMARPENSILVRWDKR